MRFISNYAEDVFRRQLKRGSMSNSCPAAHLRSPAWLTRREQYLLTVTQYRSLFPGDFITQPPQPWQHLTINTINNKVAIAGAVICGYFLIVFTFELFPFS